MSASCQASSGWRWPGTLKVRARALYQRAPGSAPGRIDCAQPELAVALLAVDQPGGEPVDRRGRLRHVGQQILDRLDVGRRRRACHLAIGPVGIDDAALGVGDEQPLPHRIDEGFGQFIGRRARRDLHEADGGGKQIADADHGQDAEHAEQERIAEPLAEDAEDDRRAGQDDDEDDQPDDGAWTRALIDDRNRIEIAARLSCHWNLIPEMAAPLPRPG